MSVCQPVTVNSLLQLSTEQIWELSKMVIIWMDFIWLECRWGEGAFHPTANMTHSAQGAKATIRLQTCA